MQQINCNIIRDILPLYNDNVVSQDTYDLVSQHLTCCDDCKRILEQMQTPLSLPVESDSGPLRTIRKKWTRKVITSAIAAFSAALVILGGLAYILMFPAFLVDSKEIELTTEFQHAENAYLDQEFVLHAKRKDGEALFTGGKIRNIYGSDTVGNKVLVGYELELKETLIPLIPNPSSYTMGYYYEGDEAPDENFNFTIKVIFKDTEIVYSMREEGLFVQQSK